MEIFVSWMGDPATLGRSVGRELGPITPWFVFPFILFLLTPWEGGSFTQAAPLRCDRVEFVSCGDASKTRGTLAVWTNTWVHREMHCRNFRRFSDY